MPLSFYSCAVNRCLAVDGSVLFQKMLTLTLVWGTVLALIGSLPVSSADHHFPYHYTTTGILLHARSIGLLYSRCWLPKSRSRSTTLHHIAQPAVLYCFVTFLRLPEQQNTAFIFITVQRMNDPVPGLPWIFPIHIHIHIHRFCVDIHGYIHIHRCLSCIDVSTDCPQSTVGFYCLLILKIYKRKNKMFAFDKTKEYVFIECTYMY